MEKVVSIAPDNRPDEAEGFEFMNAFGVIFKSKVFIHQFSTEVPIHLNAVRRVEVRKRRKYHLNALCFMIAAVILLVAFRGGWQPMVKYILAAVAILPAFAGIFNTDYEYKFLVVRNYDVTEIKVKEFLKDDAKKMAAKINKKLRKPSQSSMPKQSKQIERHEPV